MYKINQNLFSQPETVLKQQQFNNLEKYVNLECDLTIKGNVLPAVGTLEDYFKKEDISIFDLFRIIAERQFKRKVKPDIKLNKLAVIKTKAKISFKDKDSWRNDPLFSEYSKYKDNFINGDVFTPIILTHPGVLKDYMFTDVPEFLYQVDGMHRVMSALEAGKTELDCYVIVRRMDLKKYLRTMDKEVINSFGSTCTWFPRYQEIKEVGLKGQRVQEPRYTEIYDFSNLKDKVVVDFGGNLGQAAIEAYFNGAKKIYNFDYQECVINTGAKISEILGLDIVNNTIDFNLDTFEKDVEDTVKEWDWTIYQAIYRTKEIIDVNKSFTYIVKNTKEGMYFEGNGAAEIDTPEFYDNVFKPFNFKEINYLGHSQLRPAYKIIK